MLRYCGSMSLSRLVFGPSKLSIGLAQVAYGRLLKVSFVASSENHDLIPTGHGLEIQNRCYQASADLHPRRTQPNDLYAQCNRGVT